MTTNRTPVVETKHGKVKGVTFKNLDGGEFLAFEGIPYAEPPIGPLRYKDPQPLKPWTDILDLNETCPKASQYDLVTESCMGTEDCLYLNVATNSLVGKRAVMVWIHGGGFSMSTSSFQLNGPDYLVKHDIVFVSINYRLGCFGFLNLGLPEAAGNQGLKDLVAGLNWVQQNIESFGGDANNVTIFGESAGGVAVHLLALSPLAEGMFHKIIAQSGVCLSPWGFSSKPVDMGLCLASLVSGRSIDDADEALKILSEAPQIDLIEAQRLVNLDKRITDLALEFLPSVDSKSANPILPEHPREWCKRGIKVPMIIGSTSDEGIACLSGSVIESFYRGLNVTPVVTFATLLNIDLDSSEKIVDTIKTFYFGGTGTIIPAKQIAELGRMVGDASFFNGIQKIIEIQSKLPTNTYVYQFSYVPAYPTLRKVLKNNIPGCGHGDELGALFHSPLYMGNNGLRKGTKDYIAKERLTRMWTNFAKTGNPTPKLDALITIKWEPITEEKMNYLEIHETLIPSVNFSERRWKFWKPILEAV